MELFNKAYFGKSFMMIGDSLPKCLNCSYCRANDNEERHFNILPTEINPLFNNIPIAVNLFYGDPMLQIDNTLNYLERLEKVGHKGPIIIITKGDLRRFPKDRKFNLNLHFGLSTFGINSKYDGGAMERFVSNLDYAKELGYNYSIEFRPIIRDINDSKGVIEGILKLAEAHKTSVGYCGLQVSNKLAETLKNEGIEFKPYEGHSFGMKKYVSQEVHDIFQTNPNVHPFKKTSCLIAWKHGLERDPNAHYYRPTEVGCDNCPMYEKCMAFKDKLPNKLDIDLPFDYDIVKKEKHVCGLVKLGVCKFPSEDCKNLKGKFIKIDKEISTSDVRLIKWLTGFTVDAPFVESPYISTNWTK